MASSVFRRRNRSTPATRFEAISPSIVNNGVPGKETGSIFSVTLGLAVGCWPIESRTGLSPIISAKTEVGSALINQQFSVTSAAPS
jgi:hypothetical protein